MSVIDLSVLAPERLRPLRREEYDRLVELGCFEDERIELLEGALVEMSRQRPPHMFVIRKLTTFLVRAVGERAVVQVQGPFAAGDDSEPQPDLAIIPDEDYARAHPSRAFLIVEVADSSLRKDRLIKARLYARAGVPEYWIVNLDKHVVEVHRAPDGDRYARVTTHASDETIRPEAFDDIAVRIADMLPR
jgi:Uma2 family endonuclease